MGWWSVTTGRARRSGCGRDGRIAEVMLLPRRRDECPRQTRRSCGTDCCPATVWVRLLAIRPPSDRCCERSFSARFPGNESQYFFCFAYRTRFGRPRAPPTAARSPKYQLSSSRHAILMMVSGFPASRHFRASSRLTARQSAASWSRSTTNTLFGTRQPRNRRTMFFSRSCFPSKTTYRICTAEGSTRGSNPFSISRADGSSRRNTRFILPDWLPRRIPASTSIPSDRLPSCMPRPGCHRSLALSSCSRLPSAARTPRPAPPH